MPTRSAGCWVFTLAKLSRNSAGKTNKKSLFPLIPFLLFFFLLHVPGHVEKTTKFEQKTVVVKSSEVNKPTHDIV